MCSQLFKIQQKTLGINPQEAFFLARQARLTGTARQTEQDDPDESQLEESEFESEDEEVIEFIKNESVKLQSSKARAAFFTGVRFQLRLDTFEIRLIVPRREIVYLNEIYPNFHISVNNLCLKAGFVEENLAC